MLAMPTAPVAGRFTRTHEGYVHPERLDRWEKRAFASLPQLARPKWPGGSISGCDDGWDDCDE